MHFSYFETGFRLLGILSRHLSGDVVTAGPGENSVVPDPDIVDNVYGQSCERMRSVHAC